VLGDTAKHVREPGLRVDAIELGRLDQGIGDGGRLAATFGADEQKILAAQGNLRVILPISGILQWFTIAGIRFAGGKFAGITASDVPRANWFILRWPWEWSLPCPRGCSILSSAPEWSLASPGSILKL